MGEKPNKIEPNCDYYRKQHHFTQLLALGQKTLPVSTLTNRNENNGSKKIKSQVTYFFMFFFRKQQQQSHTKYINVYQFRMESESQYS